MRILTYNIWNSEVNFKQRLELLCNLIIDNEVDIIGLQEVKDESTVNYIKDTCGFEYTFWKKYDDCEEGLAILSKYPFISKVTNWDLNFDIHNSGVMRTLIDYKGTIIGITNTHLDYKSALNREIEAVRMIKMIENDDRAEYEVLLGDFNSYPNSSVYRYLTGQQSLDNHATSCIDLDYSYCVKNNSELKVTLDFNNNPRWDNEDVLDIPGRFDWILLKNPYPKKYPKLNKVKIIGNKRIDNITASDHYGVLCDISF